LVLGFTILFLRKAEGNSEYWHCFLDIFSAQSHCTD